MSFDYINEAFKRLNALNEEMFDTSLTGMNGLADFMEEDDASDIVKVIDPTAETEDAVSDSYIGKVIINCNVCHSHIFEDKQDVVIDEDGVVNPEMQCPYCGELSGFTVVGEIKPFEQETPAEEPAAEPSVEADPVVDTPEDAPEVDPVVEKLDEGFDHDAIQDGMDNLKSFLRSKGHACKTKEAITYLWSVVDLFEAGDQEMNPENIAAWYEETSRNFPEDLELFESIEVEEEILTEGKIIDNVKKVATRVGADAATIIRCFTELGEMAVNIGNKGEYRTTKLNDLMTHVENKAVLKALMSGNETVMNGLSKEDIEELEQDIAEYEADKAKKDKHLDESIEELSLTANGTHIEVDEDEDGKVTLTAEPVPAEGGDQVIAPLSDDTIAEIEAQNDVPADVGAVEDTDPAANTDDIELEVDEVDEEGLDELGEAYLKNIYENVESFKTTNVSTTESSMIVEGTIKFTSGSEKNTGFVFEAFTTDGEGRVKFVGKNRHFSESVDAFELTGTISEKKLLPESLSYNYIVGDQTVNGIVNKK